LPPENTPSFNESENAANGREKQTNAAVISHSKGVGEPMDLSLRANEKRRV